MAGRGLWSRAFLTLALFAHSSHAAGNPRSSGDRPQLDTAARSRLTEAANDSQHPPWQREFMLALLREAPGPSPRPAGSADPTRESRGAARRDDGDWVTILPSPREAHAAIYDPVRHRMLTFGGGGGDGYTWFNDVSTLSLSGEPQWNTLAPRGAPPEARYWTTATYDPVRNRMVIFGGVAGGDLRTDVWTLSLSGAPAWRELTTIGPAPSPRLGATAIYDPVRERMLVFGGWDASHTLYADVWALSLLGEPVWSQLAPAGPLPSGRYGHTAIYDSVHDRMVIFGGITPDPLYRFNDTWALSLSGTISWNDLTPIRGRPDRPPPPGSRPGGRWGHMAIYHPARERMVIFGGADVYGSPYNDVWVLSLADSAAWTPLNPGGNAPLARYLATAIYDPAGDRMVVFGGGTGRTQDKAYASDVWALALSGTPSWSPLLPPGAPPSRRSGHASIFDPVRERMIVFGGSSDELWALSLAGPAGWSRVLPDGPSPQARSRHTAIYDSRRDRMVVFGGYSRGSPYWLDGVWALSLSDTPSWTELTPTGPGPSGRAGHTAIYDPVGDRMVVFGGSNAGWFTHYNDVWALSLSDTPSWTRLTPAGATPVTRAFHTAIYDPPRARMVILGGITGGGPQYLDDLWALSLSGAPSWTRLDPAGAGPGKRQWHTAIYNAARERMVIDGGYFASGVVWALSLAGRPSWAELTPEGAGPGSHMEHTAIYDPPRDRMVIFGGPSNDVWTLDWERRASSGRAPQPHSISAAMAILRSHPNPFRANVTFELAVASPSCVTLAVHDLMGRAVRRLAEGGLSSGPHAFVWDGMDAEGRPVPNGIYFARVSGAGAVLTEKILLMR